MTSNIGARFIQKKASLGFQYERGDDEKGVQEMVLGAVQRTFNPEFINRVDELIVFDALNDDELEEDPVAAGRSAEHQPARSSHEGDRVARGLRLDHRHHLQGPFVRARPLRRAIQRYIEDPLAEQVIRGHLQGGEIEVYLEGGQLAYRPARQPVVAGRRLTSNV